MEYVAKYGTVLVGNEADNYRLRVAHYSGNAGDSMSYQNEMMFTTYDRDNDQYHGNCAQYHAGGFWYKDCYRAGMTAMKGLHSGFSWYRLRTTVGRYIDSASMWLTC